MKVTDEMLERAGAEWEHGSSVLEILEAALADVPEPLTVPAEYASGSGGLGGPEAYRLSIGYERQRKRIAELEAQLSLTREAWGMTSEAERDLEAKLSLARARRADLLEMAAEWKQAAKVLDVRDPMRHTLQDCAEELRVLAERLPE